MVFVGNGGANLLGVWEYAAAAGLLTPYSAERKLGLLSTSALSNRNFAIYFSGTLIVLHGLWIYRLTISWLAWELTHSVFLVGVVSFCQFAPGIVLGPIFGVAADRYDLVRTAMFIHGGMMILSLVLAAITGLDRLTIEILAGFAVLQGMMGGAYTPTRLSLITQLVPRELFASATGYLAVAFNLSRFMGPALAGLVITLLGAAWAFGLFACLIIPAMISLVIVEILPRKARKSSNASVLGDLRDGLQYTLTHPTIRWLLILVATNGVLARGVLELLPAVTEVLFGGGSAEFAALTTAAGAGAIVASIVVTRTQNSERLLRIASSAALASSCLLLGLGMTENYWIGISIVAGLGCSCTLCGVGVQALIQLKVDDNFRGRVLGLWGVFAIGATAVGGLLLGSVARVSSISTTAIGSAIILAVLVVLIGGALIRGQELERHS